MSLKRRAGLGVLWSAVEVLGTSSINFLVQLILARLLQPEDFGLVAIVAILTLATQLFAYAGLGEALVQAKEVSRKDLSTVFYLNLVVSLVATSVLWMASPWIASWYQKPILRPVIRVLSLTILIAGIGEGPRKILLRNLDFRKSSMATVPGVLAGGLVGITMALLGCGVWSLVWLRFAQCLVTCGTILLVSPLRPGLEFSWQSARRLFPFGSSLAATQFVGMIFDNLYTFVIGTLYSFTDLGFFTRAQAFQRFPSSTLAQISQRVLFSVLSSIQDNVERVRSGMRQALILTVLLNFPLMGFLAVAAESIVLVLLKEKWLPSVPYMKLFTILGFVYPLYVVNVNVLLALGRSQLVFSLAVVNNCLTVLSAFITYRFGISAMIWGLIAVSLINISMTAFFVRKFVNYAVVSQIRDVGPYALATVFASVVTYLFSWCVVFPPLVMLILQFSVFSTTYVMICHICRLTGYVEAIRLVRKLRESGLALVTAKSAP